MRTKVRALCQVGWATWLLLAVGLTCAGAKGDIGSGEAPSSEVMTHSPPWPAERVVTWDAELQADADRVVARLADPDVPHEPRIRDLMSASASWKLVRAFAEAERRVVEIHSCAALFARLGDDGLVKLRQTFYLPATDRQEDVVCRRGALAFTQVGSPLTRLCLRWEHVDRERAVLTLLHEALHFAGLTEWPGDPEAMTSAQIDRVVGAACGREDPQRHGGRTRVQGALSAEDLIPPITARPASAQPGVAVATRGGELKSPHVRRVE